MNLEVLIVDDDKMVLYYHRIMVEESGLSKAPVLCMNGKEALDYLLAHDIPSNIFCVLLDINMPVMNGWEFLDEVACHTVSERMFVVIVTSSIDKVDKQKAESYPHVFDYLEKPITLEMLRKLKSSLLLDKLFSGPGDS
jgi:CheY-like chemotaxis protein